MPTSFDLDIHAGSEFAVTLTAKNSDGTLVNLSGYSARGYVKKSYADSSALLDLQPSVHTSYVSGLIDIAILATGTSGLAITQGLYDIEIYTTGTYVSRILQGKVNIYPNVTQ